MKRSTSRRPLVIVGLVVLALVAAGGYFLFQHKQLVPPILQPLVGGRSVHVLGQAMSPTLKDNQIVAVDTRAYSSQRPQRGDIVLFMPPNETSRAFVMRIIAIPGDRLRIINAAVSINGQVISEPYVREPWIYNTSWPVNGQELVLPPDRYFVLGDNRNHSSDSRVYGYVNFNAIQGKLLLP